ncbi:MAG: MEDS domain-containing protein [Woeseiaceae bacterium]|nr:MEDS domain-containing protein [Woeseiaceae bacterium]
MAEHTLKEGHRGAQRKIRLGFGELYASAGDHIAHFYSSREEWHSVFAGFLTAGLQDGDKCVYFQKAGSVGDVASQFTTDEDILLRNACSTGQLEFHRGESDSHDMRALLADALAEIPGKYPRLRWAGDMTWSLGKHSAQQLMEWESHCNHFDQSQAIFLCQYDLSSFSGRVVMNALQTHPLCIVGGSIHRNPYFIRSSTS